jgi:hypothetical protein
MSTCRLCGEQIEMGQKTCYQCDEIADLRARLAKAEGERDALREMMAVAERLNRTLEAELVTLRAIVEKSPKTADGVVVTDDLVIFCPRGHANSDHHFHHQPYCRTGECWDDGCQSDSGSGTHYKYEKCYSTLAAASAAAVAAKEMPA